MIGNTTYGNTTYGNTTYDMAIRNVKNWTTNVLREANRYGVLEDSEDEECTNNKVQNFRFANMRE